MDDRAIVQTGKRRPDLDVHDPYGRSATALAYEMPGAQSVFRQAGGVVPSSLPGYVGAEGMIKNAATARVKEGRLIFANQLRGLAALSVVVTHLIGVYWFSRDIVSFYTASPIIEGPASRLSRWIGGAWFNPGPFGVALFFLISGLVIPISLQQHTRIGFVAARALRIYPTYVCAFLLSMLVVWISAKFWGASFPAVDSPRAVLSNAFLIQDFLGEPDLSLVSWSLLIEIKFYVIMALVVRKIRDGSVTTVFLIALLVLVANFIANSPSALFGFALPAVVASIIKGQGLYVVFMLNGVLFNYRVRGLITNAGLFVGVIAMSVVFAAAWLTSSFADLFSIIAIDYAYALAVFYLLFMARNRIISNPFLDGLAAISYPLYVLHSLIGFCILKVSMMALGLGYVVSLGMTLLCVGAIATALHVSVERWSVAAGKRLRTAERLRGSGVAASEEPAR